MKVTITHEDAQVGGAPLAARPIRHRVKFTVDFSDEELALIRGALLGDSVIYSDPPVTLPGFRTPIMQRLTVQDFVRRRPNRRSFVTPIEAKLFDHELQATILPRLGELLQAARRRAGGCPQAPGDIRISGRHSLQE